MQLRQKPARVRSPCIDVCVMDEDSGYCRGCKRTLDEIASWASASDAERAAVIAALGRRVVPEYRPAADARDV